MDPMKKPEWFELVEKDGGKPHASVKRSARGVLLALPLLLIGVGVVVAQGTDESPAVAESMTSVASAAPKNDNAAPSVQSKINSSVKPAIATPPKSGGDDYDDGYEDHEDGDHEEFGYDH